MGVKSVAILIPSYKRTEVLKKTLEGLFENTRVDPNDPIQIGIFVALNYVSSDDLHTVASFYSTSKKLGFSYDCIGYPDNIGKAAALNDLFIKFSGDYEYIVTMDNDMVIKLPWLHLLSTASKLDFQLIGFGSNTFWYHIPSREMSSGYPLDSCEVYSLSEIAGGMMLFPRKTLEDNRWTNKGGVYGFDDAQMCLDVSKKFVLHWGDDWLDHDPLQSSTPELAHYHNRKQQFFSQGQYILKKGWDE
jgi:glycosyltransferase involved in cell wall biosynthesis